MLTDHRLVVVVTDADSDVGFNYALHLLHVLSGVDNTSPLPWVPDETEACPNQTYPCVDALTLILTCKSHEGDACRTKLIEDFGRLVTQRETKRQGRLVFLDSFRAKLIVEAEEMDLQDQESITKFSETIKDRHSYVSHIVLSSPVSPHEANGDVISALTLRFKLVDELVPLLHAYRAPPARIIWTVDNRINPQCSTISHIIKMLNQREGAIIETPVPLYATRPTSGVSKNRVKYLIAYSKDPQTGVSTSRRGFQSPWMVSRVQQTLDYVAKLLNSPRSINHDIQDLSMRLVHLTLTPLVLLSPTCSNSPLLC